MRVFTAVDIENPETLEKLTKVQEKLDYGFNKVKPEKMHLTLQFFQNVNRDQIQDIEKAMKHVDIQPFKMKIEGVGVFPSKNHVRVVWAGAESQEIFDMKEQVSQHQVSEDNNHEFHPHITLARVNKVPRNSKKQFRRKLEKLEEKKIAETKVNSVKLLESVHNGKTTEYRTLNEEKL